ncbi:hypothetical protein ACFL7E_01900 [Thermodesulfobacteriota bacterium]
MKRTLFIILFIVFCCFQIAYAEEKIVASSPTGDSELDKSLEVLNETAKSNVRDFSKKLSRKYNIPEETTDWLLKKVGMSPGDAYMTAKVSKASNQPVEEVVKEYEANKGKGWGVIAKKLGIKPGSKEFHELKKDDSGLLNEYKTKGKKGKAKGKKDKDKGKKGKDK